MKMSSTLYLKIFLNLQKRPLLKIKQNVWPDLIFARWITFTCLTLPLAIKMEIGLSKTTSPPLVFLKGGGEASSLLEIYRATVPLTQY